ncbi:MAG TPA: LysR family transcriptional regulator [Usitatibacter sp.]|nr:LysR family transcriptional regulator [Usitatibacter sp.]
MNIKALRLFRQIVTQGSLAAAARSMSLSQPAGSRLLALLEAETRLKLFDRSGRALTLTESGEAFFREASHLLAAFDEIPRIAQHIRSRARSHLRVVTAPRFGQGLVSPALALAVRENPGMRCTVDVQSRFDLENLVGTAVYDVGIASLPVTHSLVAVENQPLLSVRAEALMPADHPLARHPNVSAAELAGEPMVGLWPNQRWRRQVDEFFRAGGATARYAIEAQSSLMACQLVRDGAGLTVLDRLSARAVDLNGMALVPLEPERRILVGCIHLRGRRLSEAAEAFLDCVRRSVETFRAASEANAQAVTPLWTPRPAARNQR